MDVSWGGRAATSTECSSICTCSCGIGIDNFKNKFFTSSPLRVKNTGQPVQNHVGTTWVVGFSRKPTTMVNMENDRQPPTPLATANPKPLKLSFDPSEPDRKEEGANLAEKQTNPSQLQLNFSPTARINQRRKQRAQENATAQGEAGGGHQPSNDKWENEKRKENSPVKNLAGDITTASIHYLCLPDCHNSTQGASSLTMRTPRRTGSSKIPSGKDVGLPPSTNRSTKQHQQNQQEINTTKQGPEIHNHKSKTKLNSQDSKHKNYTKGKNKTTPAQQSFGCRSAKECLLEPDNNPEKVVSDTSSGSGEHVARLTIKIEYLSNDRLKERLINQYTGDLQITLAADSQIVVLHLSSETAGQESLDGSNSLFLAAQQAPTSFDGIQALGFDGCPLCKIWSAHGNLANSIEQDSSSLLSKFSLHIWMKHMGPRKIWNTG